MIPAPVDYVCAGSLEEALQALGETDAKVLAGGQSLLPMMKLRIVRPALLVDIARLGLQGLEAGESRLRMGALTTWAELASAEALRSPALAAIAECVAGIGDLQVRNLGTLGGGLAHADPASDIAAVILALGARLRLRSVDGEREIAADDFLLGPFATELGPQELLTEVLVPMPPLGSGSAYVSIEHPASGFALAGAAALVRADGAATVAVTGISTRPALLPPEGSVDDVEVFGDRVAHSTYRRELAKVVVRRAILGASARARRDEAP